MAKKANINREVERIVRPIVEGQIRGFLIEHPSILKGVDWYKPRTDKARTLTNSLAKRIVRDLACGTTSCRLAAALLTVGNGERPHSTVEVQPAEKAPGLESSLGRASFFRRILTVCAKSLIT